LEVDDVLQRIENKNSYLYGDEFITKLIIQTPMQIARTAGNQYVIMYNGEDNQKQYMDCENVFKLHKEIRLGAYDALINNWNGPIKVVTSMGKQSTGKSYKLNHLFGSKFDISGADGVWMTVRIVNDTLYVICDFEGLGSFERTTQEDVLLSVFNSAISNCTVFKCENRFDQDVGEMFKKFQQGVNFIKGSDKCFIGRLLLVIKDVVPSGYEQAVSDFMKHISESLDDDQVQILDQNKIDI
jgi:hypothetical protein